MTTRALTVILTSLALFAGCDSAAVPDSGVATFRLEADPVAQERGVRGYEVTVVDEYRTDIQLLADGEAVIGVASIRVSEEGSRATFGPSSGGPAFEAQIGAESIVLLQDGTELARFRRGDSGSFEPDGELATDLEPDPGLAYLMTAMLDGEVRGFLPSVVGFTWTTTDDCSLDLYVRTCGDCGAAYCGPLMYMFFPWMAPFCQAQCGICLYCNVAAY